MRKGVAGPDKSRRGDWIGYASARDAAGTSSPAHRARETSEIAPATVPARSNPQNLYPTVKL
ncbi:hypothetical protein [Lysobacter gummosus]|uniref:hypothetical protein n=1 Tax=Lysobacter gummosus TaxID=262324 RepID=UPI003641054D